MFQVNMAITLICAVIFMLLKGIEYNVLDVTEDPAALEQVKSLGYLQAPVVITDEDHWSGFRPDHIDRIAKRAILPSDATREARSPAR
jgi:glutaredoxin